MRYKTNSDTRGVLLISMLNSGVGSPFIKPPFFDKRRIYAIATALVLIELARAGALKTVDNYFVKVDGARIDDPIARELFELLPQSFLFHNQSDYIGSEALGAYSKLKRIIMRGDIPYHDVDDVKHYVSLSGNFGGSYAMEAFCGLMTDNEDDALDLIALVNSFDRVPVLDLVDTIWGEMYTIDIEPIGKIRQIFGEF